MAVEDDDDRAVFLADFGVSAAYTPSGGSAVTVTGILDRDYETLLDGEPGGGVEGEIPVFIGRLSDFSSVAHGDALTAAGTDYQVVGAEPDGEGMVKLILEET